MKQLISTIYTTLVVGNQKAVVAALVGFIGSLGVQVDGVNIIDASVTEIVAAAVNAAIMSAAVWLKSNR